MSNTHYSLPEKVLLREDGPREGFQMHKTIVSTKDKVKLIDMLSATGISSIEVTSFVSPSRVPQHADAEIVAEQFRNKADVRYRALYLNKKGLERAAAHKKLSLEGYILIAASETFLKKNSNITLEEAIAGIDKWLELFATHKIELERIMLSTAFGDKHEGRIESKKVIDICSRAITKINNAGKTLEEVTFADTTGYANPESVKRLVTSFKSKWPEIAVGLHIHDTRGLGIANVYAGLQCGVTRFDCSVAGLGGCPFTEGASGNVPTEDVAFLCKELGIKTGINLEAYIECAKFAESLVERPLPGKLKLTGVI